jgi:hypothetical protein
MHRLARESAPWLPAALAGSAITGWFGLRYMAWGGDYEHEARPAFEALAHGHLTRFLQLVPAYGGSLVERAPFALIPDIWGGGEEAVYSLVALPCLLAAALLAVWLIPRIRARQGSNPAMIATLCLCVLNPVTLKALELGHPEELLGAVLCVVAVLLAQRDRPLWAGIVLGLAIANKEWALLAIGPVLLALPSRRIMCLLGGAGAAGAVLAPLVLVGGGGFVTGAKATAATTSAIFQPMQVFWFLGHHGLQANLLPSRLKHDYRIAPAWIGPLSHPLVIAVGVPLTALLWRGRAHSDQTLGQAPAGADAEQHRRGGAGAARRPADALLLLSALLLLRCMLDTWDNVCYFLPFLFALLAWETETLRRPPVLALSGTALVWLNVWLAGRVSADAQAAFFLVWSLPFAAALGLRLYLPGRRLLQRRPRRPALEGRLAVSQPGR